MFSDPSQIYFKQNFIFQNPCCSSRVKYAQVYREKDVVTTDPSWENSRQPQGRDLLPNWELGSDGASTPGSGSGYNCWSNNTDTYGLSAPKFSQLWAGTDMNYIQPQEHEDYEHSLLLDSSSSFEDPEKFDSWAGCEVALGLDVGGKVYGEVESNWNMIQRKTKKPKAAN